MFEGGPHLGAHDRLGEAYARLSAWLEANGRTVSGPAWEVYHWLDHERFGGPAALPDPSTWRTRLVQPIGGQLHAPRVCVIADLGSSCLLSCSRLVADGCSVLLIFEQSVGTAEMSEPSVGLDIQPIEVAEARHTS